MEKAIPASIAATNIAADAGAIAINGAARQALLSGTWDNCGQLVSNADEIRGKASQLPYFHWEDSIGA
ncbi:MAG: hypothetical protein HC890_20475 [Chloroflexaceae bacterium]|nr:hypothetical protein [Chloroflexaceae bacterium]